MTAPAFREVERCVGRAARDVARPIVLAVSGGMDSMVLLDAAARQARERVAVVATFDHGSGAHTARAAAFVCAQAGRRGLAAVVGHAGPLSAGEAAWREARWRFLRAVARRVDGVVMTAHTEDDQLETVLMRAMRGAGARGLAGLYAPSTDVHRPLVAVRRVLIEAYAAARGVDWLDDPTNASRRYFRNRVRHDLLPALLHYREGLDDELLALARRAAAWRGEIDDVAKRIAVCSRDGERAAMSVAVPDLAGYDAESLAVLWPALAARVGVVLDWRGTRRLVAFTILGGRVGASMQLAGGWQVVRARDQVMLRRTRNDAPAPAELPTGGPLRWGRWSFVRAGRVDGTTPWRVALPAGRRLTVRAWRPGDRMTTSSGKERRVKRFFGDAGIIGPDRAGWPVVLAGEEIVWIPGVGRGAAVRTPSGTPELIYSCELNDR